MEERIKAYEKYIEKEIKKGSDKEKLFWYHTEMVKNFQHEREIHLFIMLFFIWITFILLGMTIIIAMLGISLPLELLILLGVLDVIMAGLSIAYVRHYYFLENHVQKLYDWFEKLKG